MKKPTLKAVGVTNCANCYERGAKAVQMTIFWVKNGKIDFHFGYLGLIGYFQKNSVLICLFWKIVCNIYCLQYF